MTRLASLPILLLPHVPRQYVDDLYRGGTTAGSGSHFACSRWSAWKPSVVIVMSHTSLGLRRGGSRCTFHVPCEARLGDPHTSDHTFRQLRVKKYFRYFYSHLIS